MVPRQLAASGLANERLRTEPGETRPRRSSSGAMFSFDIRPSALTNARMRPSAASPMPAT